ELGGVDGGGQQRNLLLIAEVVEIVGGGLAVRQENGGNTAGHKVFQMMQAPLDIETRVVRKLFRAEHLYARGVDEVQVADQVGARHAKVRYEPVSRALAGDPGKGNLVCVVTDEFLDGEHGVGLRPACWSEAGE